MKAIFRKMFLRRWEAMKEAKLTHPWARWLAVQDSLCAPACMALHGRVWQVDGAELAHIVDEHLNARIPNCRCRLQPLSNSALKRMEG